MNFFRQHTHATPGPDRREVRDYNSGVHHPNENGAPNRATRRRVQAQELKSARVQNRERYEADLARWNEVRHQVEIVTDEEVSIVISPKPEYRRVELEPSQFRQIIEEMKRYPVYYSYKDWGFESLVDEYLNGESDKQREVRQWRNKMKAARKAWRKAKKEPEQVPTAAVKMMRQIIEAGER